jgi:predicted TIM-barrel fold metal-dependent hydrolase
LPAARLAVETLGPDRVLYGSDAPPLTSLKPRAIELVNDLNLPAPQRDAVFWRNAAKLLKLPVAAVA